MLELYKNIKSRRIELEMSQQELSSLVGYSGKSMISKIERGEVDLSQTMIQKFADALRTTPGELMGYEEEKSEVPEFDPDHLELIDLYSKLTKDQKKTVMNLLRDISICIIIYCYYTFCITFFIKSKMKI